MSKTARTSANKWSRYVIVHAPNSPILSHGDVGGLEVSPGERLVFVGRRPYVIHHICE